MNIKNVLFRTYNVYMYDACKYVCRTRDNVFCQHEKYVKCK